MFVRMAFSSPMFVAGPATRYTTAAPGVIPSSSKLCITGTDGTKVKANASLSANRTLSHLEQEIDKMLSEASAKDAEEDNAFGPDKRGDEMPDDLRDRNSRMSRLKACQERLEQEKAQAEKAQQDRASVS
jgi:hypothetical protein